ncbi:hypothetical protein AXI64_gp148 [Vibrio phage qdvp001]|uniref:hypothetical protein n=1 Tax=Vibrio phage qdvp001 TaxID=1003177 RepID=UPI0007202E99|nr:hypothetical protein AXI64_gp148 [Vibrio phage qdvp001]ALM62140.1 hypothetical protein qdvp001_148 [Vibrio phage qdvp001]
MIKLNNLPKEVMDVVMQTSRDCNLKASEVILAILLNTDKVEATRAAYEYRKLHTKKS